MMYVVNQLTLGLNVPDFHQVFNHRNFLNPRGHPTAYEMVLLPGMTGVALEKKEAGPSRLIKFPFYLKPLYVDENHLGALQDPSQEGYQLQLTPDEMMGRLQGCLGKPYLWGGNFNRPSSIFIPWLDQRFRTIKEYRAITLDGLDCSGLLYYASGFKTPRNTAELQSYGTPLHPKEALQPLDLILIRGHVMIVYDSKYLIHATQDKGVLLTRLDRQLARLNSKKKQVDLVTSCEEFSIRRPSF
jgi:hypothetical protein